VPGRVGGVIVTNVSVDPFVRLFVREHISRTTRGRRWLGPSLVALRYLLPVLSMTPLFAHNRPLGGMPIDTVAASDVTASS